MLLRDWVPAHGDGLDGSKGAEGGLEGLLSHLEVDAANVDPAHQHDSLGRKDNFEKFPDGLFYC